MPSSAISHQPSSCVYPPPAPAAPNTHLPPPDTIALCRHLMVPLHTYPSTPPSSRPSSSKTSSRARKHIRVLACRCRDAAGGRHFRRRLEQNGYRSHRRPRPCAVGDIDVVAREVGVGAPPPLQTHHRCGEGTGRWVEPSPNRIKGEINCSASHDRCTCRELSSTQPTLCKSRGVRVDDSREGMRTRRPSGHDGAPCGGLSLVAGEACIAGEPYIAGGVDDAITRGRIAGEHDLDGTRSRRTSRGGASAEDRTRPSPVVQITGRRASRGHRGRGHDV